MANIGRRSFIKSIGFPALFLPFIKLFPSHLKNPKTMSLYVDKTKVAESKGFPVMAPSFSSIEAKCSKCGFTLKIPYYKGSEPYHFVQALPCSRCGEDIKFDALIKTAGCYFHS